MLLLVLVVLLALPLLAFIYFELKYFRHRRALSVLPGPPTLPVIGNAHQFGKTPEEVLIALFHWWHKYNHKKYRLWIGYIPNIAITEPKDFEYILSSTTFINKSYVYEMLHPWLGFGLLTSTGKHWHARRKLITPSFHFKILLDFHDVMNSHANKFIEHLRRLAAGDNIIDFQEQAHYYTLDVICDTAMGVSINAIDQKNSKFVEALKFMLQNILLRSLHPWKSSNRLYKLSSDYSEYLESLNILRDFTNNIIADRIKSREMTTIVENDDDDDTVPRKKLAFLDTLLSATIDGRPLKQDEIYEEVATFMFEGHDTTTSGVTFATYLLSTHPRIQQKVFEEQVAVLGNNIRRDPTFQEIANMKYLDLFIKEAQRIYPSVPMVAREADRDYDMNGTLVPKGTSLNLLFMMLGYDERIFKDPHICRPERFETEKPAPFEYLPFSAGLRNCIGQKFATLEMKTILAKIVRTFEILPALPEMVSEDDKILYYIGDKLTNDAKVPDKPSKYEPILTAVLTLKSANGIHIRLRERSAQ